ncbi:hypothetical protein Z517_09257 [Fonsecaea pedrosoi CBS 271.37]|uniref:Uncharacterized protein n=1 Tax=Fonsecaea pedrosoi CBS 271.37 TaxID=1442368 RepID=A0A0D2G7Z6_9EURO|nr:uncharacterized protein Z517_09257 [Fonsecaea pedrosoi CBS 271.37]KIW76813.1 hypothetical protein Z517_09257 [Fonsecaea pedrosoi CBS 271.37]
MPDLTLKRPFFSRKLAPNLHHQSHEDDKELASSPPSIGGRSSLTCEDEHYSAFAGETIAAQQRYVRPAAFQVSGRKMEGKMEGKMEPELFLSIIRTAAGLDLKDHYAGSLFRKRLNEIADAYEILISSDDSVRGSANTMPGERMNPVIMKICGHKTFLDIRNQLLKTDVGEHNTQRRLRRFVDFVRQATRDTSTDLPKGLTCGLFDAINTKGAVDALINSIRWKESDLKKRAVRALVIICAVTYPEEVQALRIDLLASGIANLELIRTLEPLGTIFATAEPDKGADSLNTQTKDADSLNIQTKMLFF